MKDNLINLHDKRKEINALEVISLASVIDKRMRERWLIEEDLATASAILIEELSKRLNVVHDKNGKTLKIRILRKKRTLKL